MSKSRPSLLPRSTAADAKLIEVAAKALAWSELSDHGRATCDWIKDFGARERQEYRVKAAIVLRAVRAAKSAK